MSILDTIIEEKAREVAEAKKARPLESLKKSEPLPRRGFTQAIRSRRERSETGSSQSGFAVIAEIKRASPSKGPIRPDLNPVQTAREFAEHGAACLSVLTDRKFFDGRLEFLSQIRHALPDTPLLRKDFLIDEYQIWESKAHGADCILLIAAALSSDLLAALYEAAQRADLEVLIEVHSLSEAKQVLRTLNGSQPFLFGINNRNLKTFQVDLAITEQIMNQLPALLEATGRMRESLTVVSESGIFLRGDLERLSRADVDAYLIGESLVAKGSPGRNLHALIDPAG